MIKAEQNVTVKQKPAVRSSKPSLRPVVGVRVYNVWLDMLRYMVPQGRTHRLSVLVASFLQYAAQCADSQWDKEEPPQGSAAAFLVEAWQDNDLEAAESTVGMLAEQLFKDAGVEFIRMNRHGEQYSIAENAVSEFMRWEEMPWD